MCSERFVKLCKVSIQTANVCYVLQMDKKRGRQPKGRGAVAVVKRPAEIEPMPVTKRFATKITKQHIVTAVKALEMGLPTSSVASLIGVTKATFHRWRELGSREDCADELLAEFAVETEKARARACMDAVSLMQQHSLVDWRAALELLKASDPEVWGAKSSVKVDATLSTKSPEVDFSALSDEEFRVYRALEEKTRKKDDD